MKALLYDKQPTKRNSGCCFGERCEVYAFEDLFTKLPIHWMWWPAIGGLFVGIGGIVEPRVLGVGRDTIRRNPTYLLHKV